jgi:hypothetical protein
MKAELWFISNSVRRLGRQSSLLMKAAALIVILAVVTVLLHTTSAAQPGSPDDLLRTALQRAREAGSYQVEIDVQQTVSPRQSVSAVRGLSRDESAHFVVTGYVGESRRARFSIEPRRISQGLQLDDAVQAQEILITDDVLYEQEGDRWVKKDGVAPVPGLNTDALTLLAVAKDIHHLEPEERLTGRYERVGFTLHSRDVLRLLLAQQGEVDELKLAMVSAGGLSFGGTGELWVDETGLPARLVLNLELDRSGEDAYHTVASSTADYGNFGMRFASDLFDPTISPLTQVSTSPIPGSGVTVEQLSQWITFLVTLVITLGLCWLLMSRRSRFRATIVSLAVVVALLSPYAADAVRAMEPPAVEEARAAADASGSEVVQMLQNARDIADRHRVGPFGPTSVPLQDTADEDQDGLPNGYELKLGTNPFISDTDMDGLTDYEEVTGPPCSVWVPSPNEFEPPILITQTVETNPLMADSNGDGLRDGDEFHDGLCAFSYLGHPQTPFAWNDDNDFDSVPDGLDLSPFSHSEEMGGVGSYYEANDAGTAYDQKVYFSNPGSNLTFETTDSDPGVGVLSYPFYVELQIHASEQLMRAAFKKAMEWPKDLEGSIRNNGEGGDAVLASIFVGEDLRSSGTMEIVPFLQTTVEEADLPDLDAMQMYGVTATKEISGCVADCTYSMVLPLVPVERNGQVFALQTKMLYDRVEGITDFFRHWRDVRLKWAVQGDVVRSNEEGNFRPSPTNSYGLMVYDTPYTITGLRVSRQGGTAMFVAGAEPTATPELFDDGPIALLRAGMEAQFLTGRLSIEEIGDRFDYGSSASITETWGITHTYRIRYGHRFYYHHLDLALLTTMQVTTRNLLEQLYPTHDHTPTLILASEQRTANINADDLSSVDFSDLAINTCLKPLVTSRSLKLQTYRYDPTASSTVLTVAASTALGDWVPLTLDEVLAKVQSEFDQNWPEIQDFFDEIGAVYGSIEELYNEALNVLQMATAAWHMGQTAIQKMGTFSLQDLGQALSDSEMLDWILTESGLLPDGYAEAVYFLLGVMEAGGPIQWLENQFSQIVSFVEGVTDAVGGFLDSSPSLTTPSEATLLSWTQTAINVLNYLAVITGIDALADIADIITTLIEVYKIVRQLVDAITAIVAAMQTTEGAISAIEGLLNTLLNELQALAGSMNVMGLIMQIGMTWVGVAIVLATNSLPSYVVASLIVRAIIETIFAVVLFVIAAVVPIVGVVLLFIVGILKALGNIFGVSLDPLSVFLDWALDYEVHVLSSVSPELSRYGAPHFEALDPMGGVMHGESFRTSMTSTVTILGSSSSVDRSWAGVKVGYYADGDIFEFCTEDLAKFTSGLQYYDEYGWAPLGLGINPASTIFCRKFRADVDRVIFDPYCVDPDDCPAVWKITPSAETPNPSRGPWLGFGREIYHYAYADLVPRFARVNTWIMLDVSLDAATISEVCTTFLGIEIDCDDKEVRGSSPPQFSKVYFDILPQEASSFWWWGDILNRDPDGDGLEGYVNPANDKLVGPDTKLCATPSHEAWDADGDGLSDKFEYEMPEVNPCKADSDSDGLEDGQELLLGTSPDDADTDDDGLQDGQELAYWDKDTKSLVAPWRIPLSAEYPGLPDPAAFPNPRHANLDGDHRTDKREKHWLSSPNAFTPVPDEPVELMVDPQLIQGGGTTIHITTSPWPNDGPAASDVGLTVTLPVTFSNLGTNAGLLPLTSYPQFNFAVPQDPFGPYAYTWSVPPIWLNRYLTATLTGMPAIPPAPVTVTAQLVFTHVGKLHVVTDTVPLPINLGGPTVTVDVPEAGAILPGGAMTVTGSAQDPELVSAVYVCAETEPTCSGADWQLAFGQGAWLYTWTPPTDDVYYIQAYGIDGYGVPGPASAPITVSVDGTPPSGVQFDLRSTAYVSTTFFSDTLSTAWITGRITDAVGGEYVSGAGDAVLLVNRGPDAQTAHVKIQPTDEPGALSSAFAYPLELPYGGLGGVAREAAGVYTLTVGATDQAGNAALVSDTLRVLIDDTPPLVYGPVPQVAAGTALTLTGRADDTALVRPRLPKLPYTPTMSLASSDTSFVVGCQSSQALVVGDVNGDVIDDVVLIEHCPGIVPTPFWAGLFFGLPGGFVSELDIADADVVFVGETSTSLSFAPAAAGRMDVNGDGVGDLLLGDPDASSGEGRAYLILGRRGDAWPSSFGLADADWTLSATGTNGFGGSVASAGDVDGDGLTDVLVGAADDGTQIGVAYLYLGRERGVPPVSSILNSPHSVTAFTPAPPHLAGLGDANGDGLSDLLIAYPGLDTSYASAVALVHGRSQDEWPAGPVDLDGFADALFTAPGDLQTVSPVGDVNADGLRDLLIGDPTNDVSRVFVVFGRRSRGTWPAPPAALDLVTDADASYLWDGTNMGAGLTPMGDLDGDGRSDFAFGNSGVGFGPNRTDIVLAAHISHTLDLLDTTAVSFLITGWSDSQQSGEYLSSGDVNGDGVRDLLIGAPGDTRAYLIEGGYDPGDVSGIRTVQVGLYGPVADPTLPYSETLPSDWRVATLDNPGGAVTPWDVVVALPGDGEYRAYARATDRAGNVWVPNSWYLGNVWVNTSPIAMTDGSATLDPPDLVSKTQLSLAGAVTSTYPIQALRVYDGHWWYRRMPVTGTWSHDSVIPRTDLITRTFRAVARDAFGHTLHVSRSLTTDTLVLRPPLLANLPINYWHTDITPTLVVTWPTVLDASTIVSTWATIDTFSNTVPNAPVYNEVKRELNAPGVYYAHVSVQDGAGNSRVTHVGPFLVNRTRTPSVILPDGRIDATEGAGEYFMSTLLNYDPYAAAKPMALGGTWNADKLYLGSQGNSWGQYDRLSIYLDTVSGGISSTLAPFGVTHTLPFEADFAFMIGQESPPAARRYGLYQAGGGEWTEVVSPTSFAVTWFDTEIVLDRDEIGAGALDTPVQLLAYAEDDTGVWAVLPASARPTRAHTISGTVAFADSLQWPGLGDGIQPGDGHHQVIAPIVQIHPGWDTALFSSQQATMTVTVRNPDIAPYVNVPLTVTVGPTQPTQLVGLFGAPVGAGCITCPQDAREWVLGVDVETYGTQTVTLFIRTLAVTQTGVFALPVSAGLANSGLFGEPQPAATAQYGLDQGVATLQFVSDDPVAYVQPGQISQSFFPGGLFLGCWQDVEADMGLGLGFNSIGKLGDSFAITGTLPSSTSRVWQLRVRSDNGRLSTVVSKTLVTDEVSPTLQIAPTAVLNASYALLYGLAQDTFPSAEPLKRVEVSVNGSRFFPAFVSRTVISGGLRMAAAADTAWTFPLQLVNEDGEQARIVARAVDEAGNVSLPSDPMTVTLDVVGPTISVTQSSGVMQGSVNDGSGVAAVEVSLDGGASYQTATLQAGTWTFDPSSWSGHRVEFGIIRARDVWDNFTWDVVIIPLFEVYLPVVFKLE